MPLEINEIGIRMRVRNGVELPEREASSGGCEEDRPGPKLDELVEECVRRVLHLLRMEQER